jgi:hypothetical protein
MEKARPKIPPFGREEPGVVFALWLRDELKARPAEDKRLLAHIAGAIPGRAVECTPQARPISAESGPVRLARPPAPRPIIPNSIATHRLDQTRLGSR